MGRPHYKIRPRIMQALYEGMEHKEAMFQFSVRAIYVYTCYRLLGMRKQYVTDEEYQKILDERKRQRAKIAA